MQYLFFKVSDYYTLPICQQCGQTLIHVGASSQIKGEKNPGGNYKCKFCKSNRDRVSNGYVQNISYGVQKVHYLFCMFTFFREI